MKKLVFYSLLLLFVACQGPAGPEGLQSLVDISNEPAGQNCTAGGLKVSSGIDKNGNGILDGDEVSLTKFVCDGSNGISSLLTSVAEPKGANCPNGGTKIQLGRDMNANGQLDTSEIEQTRYVCAGANGISSLINSTNIGPTDECTNGGVKILTGKDANANGQLDADEIQTTQFVCKNGMRILKIEGSGFTTNYPTNTTSPHSNLGVVNFNMDVFADYDSVVMVSSVEVKALSDNSIDFDHEIVVELTNVNDHNNPISIPGTQQTFRTGRGLVSKNLYGKFPAGYYDLGSWATSTDAGYWGGGNYYFLLFDRK